jgi:hypothetical protein
MLYSFLHLPASLQKRTMLATLDSLHPAFHALVGDKSTISVPWVGREWRPYVPLGALFDTLLRRIIEE